MMYLATIHKYDVDSTINEEYNEHNEFFNTILEEMDTCLRTSAQLKEFGIYTEDNEQATNSIIATGLAKIGQRIIEIIKGMGAFIQDVMIRIKSGIWEAKTEEQKLRELARKYPDRIDEIKVAVSQDELKFASYRDLMDFYENSGKILDDIQKSRLDPKSARARWEAVKRKVENNNGFYTALGNGVKVVAGGVGVVFTCTQIMKFVQEHGRDRDDCCKSNKSFCERIKVVIAALKDLEHDRRVIGAANQAIDDATLLQEMTVYANMITRNSFGKAEKLFSNLIIRCAAGSTIIERVDNATRRLEGFARHNDISTMTFN